MGRNLSMTISNSDQIFRSFWPPPLQNPAYTTGSASKTPSLKRMSYTSLLNTSPNLNILTFGKPGHSFSSSLLHKKICDIFVLRHLCSPKIFSFKISNDVIACDLWFGPLQSKILATPMVISRIKINRCSSMALIRRNSSVSLFL